MTRRHFLGASAASLALPVLAKPPNDLTLGFSTYGMKTVNWPEAIHRLAEIGYDSVELCLAEGWPTAASRFTSKMEKAVRNSLLKKKLKLTALMLNLSLAGDQKQNIESLKRAAGIGIGVSPDAPPVIETIMGNGKWSAVKELFAEALGEWEKAARAMKTVVCVKPHRFGAVNRPEHAAWLAEQINSPWIKLAYDWSHFMLRGMRLKETLKVMMPHTRFIHVKDTVNRGGKARFVLPGESGQVDYATLIGTAHQLGYRGDINVEVSGQVWGQPGYKPFAAAAKCHRHLAPVMKKFREK